MQLVQSDRDDTGCSNVAACGCERALWGEGSNREVDVVLVTFIRKASVCCGA